MITPAQIRAARALLGWTQKQLAAKATLSSVAINQLEQNLTQPHLQTLNKLEITFAKAGIEFLADNGVRQRGETVNVQLLETRDCLVQLLDDILATRLTFRGDALLNGVDERKFLQAYRSELRVRFEVFAQNKMHERVLLRTGDRFFIAPPDSVTYRWIAPDLFGLVPHIIYGSKMALIFWGPPRRVLIIENPSTAETYRRQFDTLWKLAKPIPFTAKEIKQISEENWISATSRSK